MALIAAFGIVHDAMMTDIIHRHIIALALSVAVTAFATEPVRSTEELPLAQFDAGLAGSLMAVTDPLAGAERYNVYQGRLTAVRGGAEVELMAPLAE